MATKYNAQESEARWQQFWLDNETYKFDLNDTERPVYSIDTPPPTISGKLHIGHIFSFTQAEMIARYKRMKGYNVFYPMGYDDNGIPTEILVEKETKINIRNIERKDFIAKCMEVDEKYKTIFSELWVKQGFSIDWSRTYTTIQPEVQQISQAEFVKLYKKWQIVAKEFPALRCTKNQTTIAQAETEDKEFEAFFNDLKFTLEDGSELLIATTRPELLPACLAVFVHPDDERYTQMIGQKVTTPLGKEVPLLEDDKVKMDKGTGAVMCCSYGDETDVYWINKHKLTPYVVLNRYGKLHSTWIEELEGLKVKDAREKIMEILERQGFVAKKTAIVQSKSMSERGKVPVEIIPVHQWFVNILDKQDILVQQNEKMQRQPEFMKKRSKDWIENLHRDWNISRARKFGIPIPVRYSNKTWEVILPTEEQLAAGPIDPTSQMPAKLPADHTDQDIRAEEMVLDTWFTSGLSPLINQKFLERDGGKQNLMPFSLRPQAHDIIRTRLLYTTLHSYMRDESIPFENVMISGFVMAGKWEKISKSKGNAKHEPMDLLKQRGADPVRYRALGGQLGKDIVFDEGQLKDGRKLVTKLWNAFQFITMQIGDTDLMKNKPDSSKLQATDKWIYARLQATIEKMTDYLDRYEYGLAKIAFEEFFWADFCDNYLEMVKMRTYKPELFENGEEKKLAAQWTLFDVFHKIIQLIAPYLPHVTEEIYQEYFKKFFTQDSLHITSYPTTEHFKDLNLGDIDAVTEEFGQIKTIVEEVRKYKTEKQISLWADIAELKISWPQKYLDIVKKYEDDVRGVTKAGEIILQEDSEIAINITNE